MMALTVFYPKKVKSLSMVKAFYNIFSENYTILSYQKNKKTTIMAVHLKSDMCIEVYWQQHWFCPS